jgi:hypothetical protein
MLSIPASIDGMKDQEESAAEIPDYRNLIHVPDVSEADQWGWEWDGSPEGLRPRRANTEPRK